MAVRGVRWLDSIDMNCFVCPCWLGQSIDERPSDCAPGSDNVPTLMICLSLVFVEVGLAANKKYTGFMIYN